MSTLQVDLERWYSSGDESAYTRAYRQLQSALFLPPDVRRVLSDAASEEVRQDVLVKLLDREQAHLRGVAAPVSFAKTTMRRSLTSLIRKWGPREKRADEVRRHIEATLIRDPASRVEARLDVKRALSVAAKLSGKGRLAILLITSPAHITNETWGALVAPLPPPPPPRPAVPLERDEASLLLYPPQGPETAKQRSQRLNSFDKAYRRAVERIRVALGVEE